MIEKTVEDLDENDIGKYVVEEGGVLFQIIKIGKIENTYNEIYYWNRPHRRIIHKILYDKSKKLWTEEINIDYEVTLSIRLFDEEELAVCYCLI